MEQAQSRFLPDGRLWLNHGPIDLVIEAQGTPQAVERAYQAAIEKFQTLLEQIIEELPRLRLPVGSSKRHWQHEVCQRMETACWGYHSFFITPMAAVAGSVADTINAAMTQATTLKKAYVNNGGDISIFLSQGTTFSAGIAEKMSSFGLAGNLLIDYASPVRGVATSGRSGRSFSLGIADSVTVLAKNAALADAVATLIANAVDVSHPAILRQKANQIDSDSDLGNKLVTLHVGKLPLDFVEQALDNGMALAQTYYQQGLIQAAFLLLQGKRRIVAAGDFTQQRFSNPISLRNTPCLQFN